MAAIQRSQKTVFCKNKNQLKAIQPKPAANIFKSNMVANLDVLRILSAPLTLTY